MEPIYKEVRRKWRERLFSLTPWRATTKVRDYGAELDATLRRQKESFEAQRRFIQHARKAAPTSKFTPPAPMPPAPAPAPSYYTSPPTSDTSMTDMLLMQSMLSSSEPPAPAPSFGSGSGGDFVGGGASSSWDSSGSCSSSDSSNSYDSGSSSCDSSSSSSDW